MKICKIPNCNGKYYAKECCRFHYRHRLKAADLIVIPKSRRTPFTVEEINDMIKRRTKGEKLESIGMSYNCSHTTIRRITISIPSPPDHYGRGNRKVGSPEIKIPKPKGRPKKILNKKMEMGL